MKTIAWLLMTILHGFGAFLVLITKPIYRWLYETEENVRPLPPIKEPLLLKSASQLAKLVRSRKVKSEKLVQVYIDRIQEVNGIVNAVVANRYQKALEEAREVDRVLDSGDIPENYSEKNAPFLGVPITIKECFALTGMPNSSGLLSRKNLLATEDADIVASLRAAGAIPVAVTNVSELCMWYESSNVIYGRTKNAYHRGRIVGGSSGGEACIISTGGSTFGVGSDIGGSIRMPAFFNGIFGHKTSTGIVSNLGQYPMAKGETVKFLSSGPMCRYADDLLPMMRVITRPDDRAKLKLDQEVDFRKLKFYYMESDGGGLMVSPVDEQIKEAVRKAASYFEQDLNATVQKTELKKMKMSFPIWASGMNNAGNESFCSLMGSGKPVRPLLEFLRYLVGFRRHTLPAIMLGIGEKLKNPPDVDARLTKMAADLKKEVADMLGEDGVLLYPTHPTPAPYHHRPLITIFNFAYTAIINVLGFPATNCPMGMSKEGVPIGIQVISGYNNDHICLAVARELEKAFGGWIPPCPIEIE